MKAVFKGYKNKDYDVAAFTAGSVYHLNETEDPDYFYVVDDTGFGLVLNPDGVYYKFKAIKEGGEHLTYSELFDDSYGYEITMNEILSNKPQIEQKQFKYYINGDAVTKRKFDDVLLCVNDFKKDGIDTSSIKFEVKFE